VKGRGGGEGRRRGGGKEEGYGAVTGDSPRGSWRHVSGR
jgi:hypothetical protein